MKTRTPKAKYLQVRAVREAGRVTRCHVLPTDGRYTIGTHSYGAVSLLLLLHPSPSLALIRAVTFHDTAERWLGDLPSTAKSAFPELGWAYERAETEVMSTLGLEEPLTAEEYNWLRAVDALELWLWVREAQANCRSDLSEWRDTLEDALGKMMSDRTAPPEIRDFWAYAYGRNITRLNDVFSKVRNSAQEAGLTD